MSQEELSDHHLKYWMSIAFYLQRVSLNNEIKLNSDKLLVMYSIECVNPDIAFYVPSRVRYESYLYFVPSRVQCKGESHVMYSMEDI